MIEIKNLGKVFKIPHEKRSTLFEHILCLLKRRVTYETFYVLKDINLSVKKGKTLGIIGANGSGKTTLLKIIAGILKPTDGTIKVGGEVVPFLDLSVGFQGDLTARENIYLYGALRGLTKKKINRKFDDIIAFAGLEKFVDTRLKDFSSGMLARLAFSTAIQTNGDIFLIDEILAVGDEEFQRKCFEVFLRLKKENKTIVLVSHNMDLIRSFCDITMLLDNGKIRALGSSGEVIFQYHKILSDKNYKYRHRSKKAAEIIDKSFIINGKEGGIMRKGEKIVFRVKLKFNKDIVNPLIGYGIKKNPEKPMIFTPAVKAYKKTFKKGEILLIDLRPKIPLDEGKYYITFAVFPNNLKKEVFKTCRLSTSQIYSKAAQSNLKDLAYDIMEDLAPIVIKR